jgi:hypothetical protein
LLKDNKVGRYGEHEINLDMSDGFLYMYGPNAEELFKVVKPVLEETGFASRACGTFGLVDRVPGAGNRGPNLMVDSSLGGAAFLCLPGGTRRMPDQCACKVKPL